MGEAGETKLFTRIGLNTEGSITYKLYLILAARYSQQIAGEQHYLSSSGSI